MRFFQFITAICSFVVLLSPNGFCAEFLECKESNLSAVKQIPDFDRNAEIEKALVNMRALAKKTYTDTVREWGHGNHVVTVFEITSMIETFLTTCFGQDAAKAYLRIMKKPHYKENFETLLEIEKEVLRGANVELKLLDHLANFFPWDYENKMKGGFVAPIYASEIANILAHNTRARTPKLLEFEYLRPSWEKNNPYECQRVHGDVKNTPLGLWDTIDKMLSPGQIKQTTIDWISDLVDLGIGGSKERSE